MPMGVISRGKPFEEVFEVEVVKAYSKPATRQTKEGIFLINVEGELLNTTTKKWFKPRIIRTTVHTGGAERPGGMIVSFPVDGASSSSTQASGPDSRIGG